MRFKSEGLALSLTEKMDSSIIIMYDISLDISIVVREGEMLHEIDSGYQIQ